MKNARIPSLGALAVALLAAPAASAQPLPDSVNAPAAGPAFDPMQVFTVTLGLAGGYGYVSMDRFNALLHELEAQTEAGGTQVEGMDELHGAAFVGLFARGYFPYFITAEIGCNVMYGADEGDLRLGSLRNGFEHNELGFEIPILVGGYYPFLGQLFLAGLVGVDVLAPSLSLWDVDGNGDLNDYTAEASAGFMGVVSLDWIPVSHFALGLDVRFRYLVSDTLKYDVDGPADGLPVQNARGEEYDLDFSGVSAQLMVKLAL
jgi:hypothetical protein